jgi:hypothetical protein
VGKASRLKKERRLHKEPGSAKSSEELPDNVEDTKAYDVIMVGQDNRELLQRAAISALRMPMMRRR